MDNSDNAEVIATVRPTPLRRGIALLALVFLSVVTIYVALFQTGPMPGRVVLLAIGVLALWGADRMRRATAGCVELTAAGLRDGNGTQIAALRDITKVERGIFAFKPSNGFLVRTVSAQPRGWRLGLWWRVGRQIGIGGMIPVQQTKMMAERLADLIEKRDPPDEAGRAENT